MQHRDALILTRIEKANGFDVHKIHFLQIQGYWSAAMDFGLHLIKTVRSKVPAQPNSSSTFSTNPFDLQGHGVSDSELLLTDGKGSAILEYFE